MVRCAENDMTGIEPSRPIPGTRAGSLPRVGGWLCLDFANTTTGRGVADRHIEHLVDYGALVAWSRHAGILDAEASDTLLRHGHKRPRAAAAALRRALALREAIYRVFKALAHHHPPDAADLSVLNHTLAAALPHGRIVPSASGFAWAWDEAAEALDRMLWPVARSAAELLTAAELRRVKQCPGWDCTWLFLDLSKNVSRRWCEMEVCGSRAKARAYYERKKAAKPGEH